MKKNNFYILTEGERKAVVTRLLGEVVSERPQTEDWEYRYCGYIDGTLHEVRVIYHTVFIKRFLQGIEPRTPKKDWTNTLLRRITQDETADVRVSWKADYNYRVYVEADCDSFETADFCFRNKISV